MQRAKILRTVSSGALALQLLTGCGRTEKTSAKELFEQTVREHHLPSATATGAEKEKLLDQSAAGYERLLRLCRDEPYWCAQALRSLGNVRAAQGRLEDAVRLYDRVGAEYPTAEWDVLQAWKSAADLLWDAGRHDEATGFYEKIIHRFDSGNAAGVIGTIVRFSKSRLT
jgi:tetratricopeptide (TPR) repeat protein